MVLMLWLKCAVISFLALFLSSLPVFSAEPILPERSYYVYVCAESDDEVAIVRYGPNGTEVVKTISVGLYQAETEAPHGINVDPNGQYWYVSLAHGFPFGSVHKYATDTNHWVGDVTLGLFPATLDISATTGLMYVVNFDLHGVMAPSTISAVEVETMTEVARISTGIMPHGSRLSRDGTRHYSVNMMNAELVEVDALGFEVNRRLFLGDGVQPTWVTRPTADGLLYVAGNNVSRIFEIDVHAWRVRRTFKTGPGPYNLDVSQDGMTLVATYKNGSSIGFWDLSTGVERARVESTRTLPHGVVISPNSLYAFVSVEGVGIEPGTVEVFHVPTATRVGIVDVGKQAGGIAFWKIEK